MNNPFLRKADSLQPSFVSSEDGEGKIFTRVTYHDLDISSGPDNAPSDLKNLAGNNPDNSIPEISVNPAVPTPFTPEAPVNPAWPTPDLPVISVNPAWPIPDLPVVSVNPAWPTPINPIDDAGNPNAQMDPAGNPNIPEVISNPSSAFGPDPLSIISGSNYLFIGDILDDGQDMMTGFLANLSSEAYEIPEIDAVASVDNEKMIDLNSQPSVDPLVEDIVYIDS